MKTRIIAAIALSLALAMNAHAQISLTNTSYSQNFDGMSTNVPATTPSGWFVGATGVGTNGAVNLTSVVTTNGANNTGTNYNFGVAGVNPINERALGSIASGTGNRVTEVRFTNNTGQTITSLNVTYDGEQWRDGGTNGVLNTLTMHFSTDGTTFTAMGAAFTFTSPKDTATTAVLDGNAASNRVAGITGNFATNIDNGVTFYLRWLDVNDPGNDDGLAIDNFSLTVSFGNALVIAATADPHGSISPSGAVSVNYSNDQSFTISPDACYHVLNVLVDSVSVGPVSSYTFTGVTNAHTINASFAITNYTITTSSSPPAGGSTSGGGTVNCGSNVTVVASANPCTNFVNWTEGATEVSTLASYQFPANADRTLVANFSPITYTITTSSSPGGGGTTSGGGTVNCGSNVTVVASANSCYNFVKWTEGATDVTASPSYNFTANANRTLVANFSPITYTITTTTPGGHGSISPGTGPVNCGANQTFTIAPNPGYQILDVVVDGTDDRGAVCNYTFTNVTGAHTISATFVIHDATYTPGNLVIYRMGRDANQNPCGDPGCALASAGTTVWLDEYTPCGQFVYAHMMPTNSAGGGTYPLIGNGTQFGEGLITLSPDGQFILVCGYGATLGQRTTSVLFSDATDVPRVIGVVGANGVVNTETALQNANSNGGQIRSAVTDSCTGDNCPTNIWVCVDIASKHYGGGGAIQYAKRGASDATKLSGYDTRQLNIFKTAFGEQLFYSSQRRGPIAALTNANDVTIPTVMNDVSFSSLAGTTLSAGPWSFVLFNLRGVDLDTLYVADAVAGVQKFLLNGTSWTPAGFISASGAVGLTGRTRIVGTTTNVDLWITGGGNRFTGGDSLYAVTDPQGYNLGGTNLIATTLTTVPSGVSGVSLRGIAFAPTGTVLLVYSATTAPSTKSSQGPSVLSGSNSGFLSVGPASGLASNWLTGCSLAATQSYSVANFGVSNLNWSANVSSNWVTLSPSSGSLTSGGSVTVQAFFNSNTANLLTGTNTATITFTNTTSALGSTNRAVQLILTRQNITPTTPLNITGPLHGPFKPSKLVYTVCNGSGGIALRVTNSTTWLDINPAVSGYFTNFPLNGCACTNITVSVNTFNGSNLPAGVYKDVVVFSNVTAGTLLGTRPVLLTVGGVNSVDNFGTFTNGPLAGQPPYTVPFWHTGTANPVLVHSNAIHVTAWSGPCDGIEPYRNTAVITSGNAYVAMVITVTSAAPATASSPSRIYTLFTKQDALGYPVDSVTARDTGSGTFFAFGVRLNGTHSNFFGGPLNYNRPYQVIQKVSASNTISCLYVNPTSPTEGVPYVCAQDAGVADPGIGSIQFGNCYPQARASAVQAGVAFYKFGNTTNFAEAFQASAPPLLASFIADPTNGPAPLTVLFGDTSTGSPVDWAWDFGDTNNNTSTGDPGPDHTYYGAGTYTVQLIVTDGAGGFSTNRQVNLIHVLTALEMWQTIYFGSPSNPNAAPNADPDGDGMSNTNEFTAGFNPTNNAANLHIISVVKTGSDIRVTYVGANGDSTWSPGIASRTNVLDFTKGAANGSYSNNFASTGKSNILSGGIGLGIVTNFVDTGGATNKPAFYYRIRLVP